MEKDIKVSSVVQKIITHLENKRETGSGKALLSALRHSIGKPLAEASSVWPLIFSCVPESFLSEDGRETDEERVIFAVLQLYALQKQGMHGGSEGEDERPEQYPRDIGESLRRLRTDETSRSLDRRFNSAITAQTFDEMLYHLRQLIKLAKARNAVPVDFIRLADDLYWCLRGNADRVRLRWAQSYYSFGKDSADQSTGNAEMQKS